MISGGSNEAIRNGIYEFLEVYLGCKWYAPNVEYIPKMSTININNEINYYDSTASQPPKLIHQFINKIYNKYKEHNYHPMVLVLLSVVYPMEEMFYFLLNHYTYHFLFKCESIRYL